MHLEQISVDGFGTLDELQIRGLSPHFNLVYGGNGSGKTTVLQLLRGLLAGFGEARRLRLLPPLKGGRGGGSATIVTPAGRFEVIRHARADHSDTLAINLLHGLPDDVGALRKQIAKLNSELIFQIFTVSGYAAHDLNGLTQCALRAGVDLKPRIQESHWLSSQIREVEAERADLFDGSPCKSRVEELESRRRKIQDELQTARLSQSGSLQRWQESLARLRESVSRINLEVDWLCQELQAVEADLSEVQDRLWSTQTVRVQEVEQLERTPVPVASLEMELEQLDREMETSRQMLRDLAARRMRLAVEQANLAGAESPDPVAAYERQRQALAMIEHQAGALSANMQQHQCRVTATSSDQNGWRQHVEQYLRHTREQLWLLCQELGRSEVSREQTAIASQRSELDRLERELSHHIRRLNLRRDELRFDSELTLRETLQHRTRAEEQRCGCDDHAHGASLYSAEARPERLAPQVVVRERTVVASRARPGDETLQEELAQCRDQLRQQMQAGLVRLRIARDDLERIEAAGPDCAEDHTIRALRNEYAIVEQQLADHREQWQSLAALQLVLQRTQQKLKSVAQAPVLEDASRWLERMTAGRYREIRYLDSCGELRIVNSAGAELESSALSRGTLEQASLCFRMALCTEFSRNGLDMPLVLDDVLADSDETRLKAAAEALIEFSKTRQVVFFTCQDRLADVIESLDQRVQLLPGSTRRQQRFESSVSAPLPVPQQMEAEEESPEDAGHVISRLDRVQPDEPYWLQPDSSVSFVPSLSAQMARRLGALGVRTVMDLIELEPELAEMPLESLQISAATLRLWQAEARLLCCVLDLTGRDAQLLAACGIHTPVELAECDFDDLYGRIRRLRQSNSSAGLFLVEQSNWPEQDLVRRWIRQGRRSRTLQHARDWSRQRRSRLAGSDSKTERISVSRIPADRTSQDDSSGTWRFYLRMDSPVVDAPSIGPRTAERLEAIGVTTVAQLVHGNAEAIAQRLDRRGIDTKTILDWQRQAVLMCRVPEVRGHDVQLLVGCGVSTAEQLAEQTPERLLRIVSPYAESKEGQRILRSGPAPDMDEVTNWIEWARQAFILKAA